MATIATLAGQVRADTLGLREIIRHLGRHERVDLIVSNAASEARWSSQPSRRFGKNVVFIAGRRPRLDSRFGLPSTHAL
jgi:hypothetical protein